YFYGTLSNNFTFSRSEFNGYFENNTVQGIPTWPVAGSPGGVTPTVGPADWDPAYAGERLANKALARIDHHVATHNGTPGNPAKPLFMYYAPLSNHTDYIAPPSVTIQGETHDITGKGKLTSGQDGSSREDLVWENDVVIGELIDKLQATIDPATGQPMINNTILIVSSDNGADHPNPVFSAGLRDRKQSIYEGGHRVPFIASWPGHIPAGSVSNQTFGHTDLYATFAGMLGEDLAMTEAEDSENIMPALLGQTPAQFTRPGFMVNHDDSLNSSAADIPNGAVLALRSGSMKLILTRDLVNVPNQPGGPNGQAIPLALFDLSNDVGESVNLVNNPQYAPLIQQLSSTALRYYNQGFSRSTLQSPYGALVREDGGADLANNLGGSVGYEFTVGAQPVLLTRLGMWDDGAGDIINQETNALNPDGDTVGTPDGLATGHWVRLFDKTSGTQLASVQVTTANSIVEGEFRYVTLPASISLAAGAEYALTMSTASGDGDMFHIPAPFSGRSPIPTSSLVNFESRRSTTDGVYPTLLPNGETATGAATESQFMHRFYVGPTATLAASLPVLQAADFNADGAVDGADFVIWQRGLGLTGATRADGDADSNGLVNAADLTIWRQAMSTPGSAGSVRGVPEPSGVALVGMVVAAVGAGVVRPRHAGRGGCAGCRS
ncbi:MAG TPA: sulfatase-like hydrolase/transferase, partial [Lacipirellulaceae bacterium]|nr:sulfatase-like hydrolase/transferase [Lacipirellulaceae bacterium]